jgi:ubiquinone/menaquinone biosynthesis C-methylase UbiE
MSYAHLDYDQIAPTFDRRYAVNDMNNTLVALQELARSLDGKSVLEVGCGTGHWLAELSTTVENLHGLDLSFGMLAQARQRGFDLMLVRGSAEHLPYPSCSMDMIFALNALHHFPDRQAFIAEAFRLLHPGGALVLIGSDPPSRVEDWYIYAYFPGTFERDLARFSNRRVLLDWMSLVGFENVESSTVEHFAREYSRRAVFDDPFLAKDSTSQLALLSNQAYAHGIQRIEQDIKNAEHAGEQIKFPSNIHIHMLIGWKLKGSILSGS